MLNLYPDILLKGFPGVSNGKESACQSRGHKRWKFDPWVGKIPWRKEWLPNPVFLPGEFHGQTSLAGYGQWDCKELDTTEQLMYTNTHSAEILLLLITCL